MSLKLTRSVKLHDDKLWSLDFNKMKNILATGSADRKVKLLSIDGESRVNMLDELDDSIHHKTVRAVSWRPNTTTLACGSFDTTVSVWTNENMFDDDDSDDHNENTISMELLAVIEGHENEVKSVAWSSDGFLLATCSRDKSIWIWETDESGEEYECVSVLQEHSQDIKHVIWHPYLPMLASSSYDDTVRIWSSSDGDDDWECIAILNGHRGTVWCSDFEKQEDPSKVRICSGSDDLSIRIWRRANEDDKDPEVEEDDDEDDMMFEEKWICENILPPAHSRSIYSVAWSEDGYIASVGSDGKLIVYKENIDQDDNKKKKWEVIVTQDLIHGVYECNVVKWIKVDGKTMILTGGDDGFVKIWAFDE